MTDIEKTLSAVLRAEAKVAELDAQIKELTILKKKEDEKAKSNRALLVDELVLGKTVAVSGHSLWLKETKEVIVDADPKDLADRFQRVKIEANKTAIKVAIEAGEEVEGAHIQTNVSVVLK